LVDSGQQDATSGRVASVPTIVLMIATVALLLALAGAAIAAWVITRQPAEEPLRIPSVAQAYFS
jgi:flagellar basal body-associated protein FliL